MKFKFDHDKSLALRALNLEFNDKLWRRLRRLYKIDPTTPSSIR